ncbi:ABC transporter ATP-binding protein [Thalassomonas viridans]|uniref:ABC transporter ATP-binding protein n=1 Tax=Thalassomonas viridans TaxID=137584 RepID=A0AAF0C989_9GAMM|nr:ABC transporter ATP-binding protein [Thalassomonas viridans]WDE04634.1 ABC transporter ATP-binding protein [Thalassomonas viridans]
MKLLGGIFKQRKAELALLFAFIFFVSLFSFLLPVTFTLILDEVLPSGAKTHFNLLIAGVFILILLRLVLNAAQDYLFLFLRSGIERKLSLAFLERGIDNFSSEALREAGAGNLSNRLLIWLSNFQYFLSEFIYFCGYALVVSLLVFVVLFKVEPVFALIALVFLLLHWFNFAFHYPMSKVFSDKYNRDKGELAELLSASFNAKRLINIFNIEQVVAKALDTSLQQGYGALYGREQVANSQELVQNLMRSLQFFAFVSVGIYTVIKGGNSIGELLLCLLLIGLAYQPVYRLSKVTRALSEANTQMNNIAEVTEAPGVEQAGATELASVQTLELADLSYSKGQNALFQGLNYRFETGKIYLIEGESGQGKTTLLQLIAGLLPCGCGQVLWDGIDLAKISPQSKRKLLSWMPQKSHFLEGSLRENISLFAPEPDLQRMQQALDDAACDFLELQTEQEPLLENSSEGLSGGQLQRLNLARTLYLGGRIRLLDEPSASLDQATELRVLQTLTRQKEDHITIIISHRKAARSYADHLLVLANGRLEEVNGVCAP